MRCVLWPDAAETDHEADMTAGLARPDTIVVVCVREAGGLCGFVEVERAVRYRKLLG